MSNVGKKRTSNFKTTVALAAIRGEETSKLLLLNRSSLYYVHHPVDRAKTPSYPIAEFPGT